MLLASGHVASFGRASYGALGRLNDDFDGNVPREAPELVDGLAGVQVASVSAGKPFPSAATFARQAMPSPLHALRLPTSSAPSTGHAVWPLLHTMGFDPVQVTP